LVRIPSCMERLSFRVRNRTYISCIWHCPCCVRTYIDARVTQPSSFHELLINVQ
jgi:hypothetical protein